MSDSSLVLTLVNSIEVGSISGLSALFLYNGYSPEMVFKHFAKIRSEYKPMISDSEFKEDIKTLMVIGVIMGNYSEKSSAGISEEGKEVGDALFKKYSLKVGGLEGDKKAITLPRVMSAFPILMSKFLDSAGGKIYSNAYGCGDLQNVLRNPVFSSVIPTSLPKIVKETLLLIATCYSAEQSMSITSTTDAKAAYETQKGFSMIAHKGSDPPDAERLAFIRTISFDYESIKGVVEQFTVVTGKPFIMATKQEMASAGLQVR